MPVHDWMRVDAGTFHHFHHSWIEEIQRALNKGLLPSDYYAMSEQIAGGLGPDVLTLHRPASRSASTPTPGGAVTLDAAPPQVVFRARGERQAYAAKAKAVAIRHRSDHKVVAVVEIVSPGNKNNQNGLTAFLRKAEEMLNSGVHLLIVDLFPPGPRDPEGLFPLIWGEQTTPPFLLPDDKRLAVMAFAAGACPEAFAEPVGVGDRLPDMPLFLTPTDYVPLPLDATYQAAWEALPSIWQDELTRLPAP